MLTTVLVAASLLSAKPTASFTPKQRPYDAISYRIEVRQKDDDVFANKVTAVLKAKKALTEIELDAYDLDVTAVTVDGEAATFKLKADPAQSTGLLLIKPSKTVASGKDASVEVTYTVKAGVEPQGIFKVEPLSGEGLPQYFTQFETQGAQRFYPCNDQPDDKATSEIFAIVDGRYSVLSNGRKEKDETFQGEGKNLRRVQWKQDQPHSTYLVALAIGVFDEVLVGGDTPATIWVQPGTKDKAFVVQDATRSILAFQSTFLGVKFPWAKLDQVAVPRFMWGGMENTSLIFNRESSMVLSHKNEIASRLGIVDLSSHEIAHQWFGDYVTLKWWDDTWLNEGFATYLGDLASDAYFDNDFIEAQRTTDLIVDYFRAEDGPRSHPLIGKNGPVPDDVFDTVSYQKGAQVLRMLELWVGRAEMKKALKAYLEKYAVNNASSDDFFAVVYASTKKEKELKPFKESWLKKRGYPVLSIDSGYGSNSMNITIRQQPNQADEKGPFVFKLPIVLHRETEPKFTVEQTIVVDKPVVTVKVDVPAAPQWVNWNKDLGALVRINTSAVSEEQWVEAARHDPDPTWRLQAVWSLMGEMVNPDVKEETRPTETAMGAIVDVLAKDPSPYVREEAMGRLLLTKWKKLPADFGPIVLAQAKRPSDLNEDAIGLVRVRSTAMELLGKLDYPAGRKYLLDEVVKREADINFLPGLTKGVARIGSNDSLATLRAATQTHKLRGYPYYRICLTALGTAENVEAASMIGDEMKANASNSEIVRALMRGLYDNQTIRNGPGFAAQVRDWVLDEKGFSQELRSRFVHLLDELKTKEAKDALVAIAEKSTSDRIKGSARQVLETNFKAK